MNIFHCGCPAVEFVCNGCVLHAADASREVLRSYRCQCRNCTCATMEKVVAAMSAYSAKAFRL